jgi:hypothetical protein
VRKAVRHYLPPGIALQSVIAYCCRRLQGFLKIAGIQ